MIKKFYIFISVILIITISILMVLKYNNREKIPEDEKWMYESELVDGEPTTVWDGTINEED